MKDARGQGGADSTYGLVARCVFVCTWVCEKEKRCEKEDEE